MATHHSPTRLAPPSQLVNDPPSPRTHRALRRLQSAHTLGQSNNSPPSLISQQRKQILHKSSIPNLQHPSQQHSRARSNSDASNMTPTTANAGSRRPLLVKRPTAEALSLDKLIREGPPDGDLVGALESTRLKILDQGIKSDGDGMSSLRVYVWLILLNAPIVSTDDYLALIHRSASPSYSKIRNDTFRTLATDPLFRRRVSEASLIRLLNAVAWKLYDAQQELLLQNPTPPFPNTPNNKTLHTSNQQGSPVLHSTSPLPSRPGRTRASTLTTDSPDSDPQQITYVQGMNVLCAPFLYASRSESQAFTLFHTLITRELPAYVSPTMQGVHNGLKLVDKVLAIVDPKLSLYLIGKGMTAEIYGFASVLTLCACTPPLPEVLRLWDFLFAYGVHLNILCIVAQLVILREEILRSPSPTKILRSFPPLQAEMIKEVTLTLIKKIPDDVYAEIVSHAK